MKALDVFDSGPVEYRKESYPSIGHLLLSWKAADAAEQLKALNLTPEEALKELQAHKYWITDFHYYFFTALLAWKSTREEEVPLFFGLDELTREVASDVKERVEAHLQLLESLPEAKGLLYLVSLSQAKKVAASKYLITRKEVQARDIKYLPALAPSRLLFFQVKKKWKDYPKWLWWPAYEAIYLQELLEEKELLKVFCRRLSSGEHIAFLCFCKSPSYCHRSLLAEIFRRKGCLVSFSPRVPWAWMNPSLFILG